MKVISLHQPFASLIFLDTDERKHHETRTWAPPEKLIGQRIGIHAAQKLWKYPRIPLALTKPILNTFGCYLPPSGCLIGTVVIAEVYQATPEIRACARPFDVLAGDWEDGRWLWRLEDPQPLKKPVPMIGRQGWWEIRYG